MIVVLAAVAMAATLPGRTHGLGLITKRMLEDLAISRESFAIMNLAATLIGALFCIPCGWLIDRGHLRTLVAFSVAALGGVVIWMATLTDPFSLAIGVALSRGIGQSMLSVISIAMVSRWFERRLGPAMGVYSVLMSLLMAVATGVVGLQIQSQGWRAGWSVLGYTLLVTAPVLGLLTRSTPRHRELEFGATAAPVASGGPRLSDALKTSCFWVFSLSISFFGLVSSGLSLFQQFVLEERGFSESVFQLVLIIGLFVGMLTNLAAGWCAQRMSLSRMLVVALALLAISLGCFPLVRELWHVYLYAITQGIAGGILTVLFFTVWGRAFGGAHLGRIQGAAQMMTVLASALGPLMVEWSRATTGSYGQVFIASALIAASLAVVAWFTPLPRFAATTPAH
jgi:MFS family permease